MTDSEIYELEKFLTDSDNATLIKLFNASVENNLPQVVESVHEHLVLIIPFAILVIVSFMSNLFVCYVIIRNKKMHTVTNMFMINMAVSDLILVLLNVPLNILRHVMVEWTIGNCLCHLLNYSLMASVYVYSYTLTAIALDRHRVLLYPLHPRMTKKKCLLITFLIWTLSFVLAIPYGIFTKVKYVDFYLSQRKRCVSNFPNQNGEWEQYVTVFTLLMQYVLPLLIIALAYCRVVHKLWLRTHLGVVTEDQRVMQIHAKRRSIKLLIAVVVVFAICWLPLNLYHILTDLHPNTSTFQYNSTVFFICHWIAISSTCINSVLYCWMNPTFRSQLRSSCCVSSNNSFEHDREFDGCFTNNVTSRQNVRYCAVHTSTSTDGNRPEKSTGTRVSCKITFKSKMKYNETYF